MSIIKCPECGKMISSLAIACPECGCPSEYFEKSDTENQEETTDISAENHKLVENNDIKSLFSDEVEEDAIEENAIEESIDETDYYYFSDESDLRDFFYDIILK